MWLARKYALACRERVGYYGYRMCCAACVRGYKWKVQVGESGGTECRHLGVLSSDISSKERSVYLGNGGSLDVRGSIAFLKNIQPGGRAVFWSIQKAFCK